MYLLGGAEALDRNLRYLSNEVFNLIWRQEIVHLHFLILFGFIVKFDFVFALQILNC